MIARHLGWRVCGAIPCSPPIFASCWPILTVSDPLDHLVSTITRHPAGLGVEALSHALGRSVSRRTLQRRLASLVQARRLALVGQGRSVRYAAATLAVQAPVVPALSLQWPGTTYRTDPYPPLSPQGEATKAQVRRARHLRSVVDYQPAFAEHYQHHVTPYLPLEVREALWAAGTTPLRTDEDPWAHACWASARLEGCSYSREEVQACTKHAEIPQGKSARDTQLVLNHQQTLRYVQQLSVLVPLSMSTVLDVHALLSDGLIHPSAMGRLRRRAVEMAGSAYRPLSESQRIHDALETLLQTAAAIDDPWEQSFFLLVQLSYLVPFDAYSHAVVRMVANIPLLRHGLRPMTYAEVPPRAYRDGVLGVCECTQVALFRDVWVWGYTQGCEAATPTELAESPTTPADIRLRYRHELRAVVIAMVRAFESPHADAVQARVPPEVHPADRTLFATVVLAELQALHPGNAVRFGLRPLELAAWLHQQRTAL